MKKLFLSVIHVIFVGVIIGNAQCTAPVIAIGPVNIFATSVTVAVSCNGGTACTGTTYYLEYGLPGFTPGTGATPGPGGTIMTAPGSNSAVQFNVTGLTPVTAYKVYARRNCSGTFSPNSAAYNFTTAFDCNSATAIGCNAFNTAVLPSGTGAWVTCNNGGPDVIYSFTPTVNGNHKLFIKKLPNAGCNFSYKAASLGCNSQNWNCIGYGSAGGITQYAFGPLTAGTQYYIKVQQNNLVAVNVEFRVECPGCTNVISNIAVSNITPYQATISWTGGPAYLELGPYNFTPGTGNQPGAGGTIYFSGAGNVTLYNLSPNTPYTYFIRAYCGSQIGPNSSQQNFLTASCPAVQTYGALGSYSYALPTSPGLFNYPGSSCNIYFVPGNETYYLFTPPATSKYQVTVNYNFQFGGYVFYYNTAGGTCDPTNYLCPVVTSGFPPYGFVTYEIGPLTGGTDYYLYFDFSDTIYDMNDVAQFKVDCVTPQATITPSGPTSICSGSQVTLNAPAGTGNTYLWSNGKTTQSITTGTAGNYALTITNTCGTSTSAPVVVTVNQNPAPTITAAGPTSFCSGGNVALSTSNTAGASYQWKKSGVNIPGAISSSYTATATGNYKVVKTNSAGCTGTSPVATAVTVYGLPTAIVTPQGPTTFCSGDSVKLKTAYNNSYSYQWKRNNVNISGATNNNFEAKIAGSYKVKVTNTNGCTVLSNAVSVSVPCRLGNNENQDESVFDVQVFPNPTSGDFVFDVKNATPEKISIHIYDMPGKLILSIESFNPQFKICHPKLIAGIYTALVCNGESKKIIKLLKTN